MKTRHRIRRPASLGFTLIELMMVVVIIALLTATLIPLIGDLVTQSRRSATRTTITKLQEILQKRLDAFERGYPEFHYGFWGREFSPASSDDIKRKKFKFREMFLTDTGITVNSEADSAEVLYKLVTQMPTFGTAAEDAGQFNAAEIGDTDGDGQMEFVDSWGRPIIFYLYPTRLIKPNGSTIDRATARYLYRALPPVPAPSVPPKPDPMNTDQDDPYGVLIDDYDLNGNSVIDGNEQTGVQNFEQNWHTFSTYHTPLIVSAGPDGLFGLYGPQDRTNFGYLGRPISADDPTRIEELYDNITNHNIKAGDK